MIDLQNTWIHNVDDELKVIFASECGEQGIALRSENTLQQTGPFLTVEDGILMCARPSASSRKITLSDFKPKPRTKTEYVKVNPNADGGSYWECARDYACGEVGSFFHAYSEASGKRLVQDNDQLLQHYKTKSLYRKVETEITWKDALCDYVDECKELTIDSSLSFAACINGAAWDNEFLEMCRVVVSAADGK